MAGNRLVCGYLAYELPHSHLICGIVAENTDVDLVAQALAFEELRLLDMLTQIV